MENLEYSFKLKKLVNNLKGWQQVGNDIDNLKHNMNNNSYLLNAKKFYLENSELEIEMSNENILTIADLNNYINWIKQYGESGN